MLHRISSSISRQRILLASSSSVLLHKHSLSYSTLHADIPSPPPTHIPEIESVPMPSAFVQGIQDMFNHVHQTLDLPWWATIIGCTVVSRAALTLFTPMHMRNSARLKFIQPKVEKLRKEKLHKPNDRELAARINREIDELYAKYRCSTKTTLLLATAQIPVFLGFLFALNSKALSVRYPDIAKESFLWVPDISQADPYYALPVISGLVLLASIELNPDFVGVGNKKMVVRGLVLVSTPFFTQFASAVHIYWLINNGWVVVQNLLFSNKSIARAFDIPNLNDPESIEKLEYQARNNFKPPVKPAVLLNHKPKQVKAKM